MNRNAHNIIILILALIGFVGILSLACFFKVSPIERIVALVFGAVYFGFEIFFFWER